MKKEALIALLEQLPDGSDVVLGQDDEYWGDYLVDMTIEIRNGSLTKDLVSRPGDFVSDGDPNFKYAVVVKG